MVGEKRKKKACAVDGRARAARRTSCMSRLSGVSRVCRHQRVVGFDFHRTSSSPEKASSKGTRDTCRRESHSDVTARRTMQTRADEGHGEGQRGDDGQVVAEA